MPSANHLSTITDATDWAHEDRFAIDEREASTAWAAIEKPHLPNQRHDRHQLQSGASEVVSRSRYYPTHSQYPPPPVPIAPAVISPSQEAPVISSNYVTPYIRLSSHDSDRFMRSRLSSDALQEDLPPRNYPPLTPQIMGFNSDISFRYNSGTSFTAGGFQMRRDSNSSSSSTGNYTPYFPIELLPGSDDQRVKKSPRSVQVLSTATSSYMEYNEEDFLKNRFKKGDVVEVSTGPRSRAGGEYYPEWTLGIVVGSSESLPTWTKMGEKSYEIAYRVTYSDTQDPKGSETWGTFSDANIRRLEEGTLLFVRTEAECAGKFHPRGTWIPSIYTNRGVIGLVHPYINVKVPFYSKILVCTQETLDNIAESSDRLIFDWYDIESFLQVIFPPVFAS